MNNFCKKQNMHRSVTRVTVAVKTQWICTIWNYPGDSWGLLAKWCQRPAARSLPSHAQWSGWRELKQTPSNYIEDISEGVREYEHVFETGVGVMLVFLGLQVFWKLYRGNIHIHDHSHEAGPHLHIHTGHAEETNISKDETLGFFNPGKPFFRLKSFVIGVWA